MRLYIQGNVGTGVINTPASEILRYYEEYDLPGPPGVKMSMGGALESRTEPMLNDAYIVDGSDISPLIAADEFANYMRELDAAVQGSGGARRGLAGIRPSVRPRSSTR